MIVGVPKEIKAQENRVAMTPAGADTLIRAGHKVLLEKGAGLGAGFSDEIGVNPDNYPLIGCTLPYNRLVKLLIVNNKYIPWFK